MIERRFKSSDGAELYYKETGPADGVPIALCHGIAVNSDQFVEDAEYFAGLGYRVLAPDLRGHGRSGKPRAKKHAYRIARLARDQAEMLDHAGLDKVHWIGNSLGGITGLAFLKDHAERLHSLTTFGTAYSLVPMPRADVAKFFEINFKVFRPMVVKTAVYLCSKDEATRQRIEKMANKADAEVVSAVASELLGYDYIEAVMTAPVPMLFMRLGNDNLMNWALGRTMKLLETRREIAVADLPEAGHCANLDDNARWRKALLGFLPRP